MIVLRDAVNRCADCHHPASAQESLVCKACLARHHPTCWSARCSRCGEAKALGTRQPTLIRTVQVDPPPASIRGWVVTFVCLVTLSMSMCLACLVWAVFTTGLFS